MDLQTGEYRCHPDDSTHVDYSIVGAGLILAGLVGGAVYARKKRRDRLDQQGRKKQLLDDPEGSDVSDLARLTSYQL